MTLRQFVFATAQRVNAMRGPVRVNEFDVITGRGYGTRLAGMLAAHDAMAESPAVRRRTKARRAKNRVARASRRANRR